VENERLIRLPEVQGMVGLSKSTLYEMISNNRFPSQRRIGKRAVAFLRSEILEWVRTRGGRGNG
jgi:prophage regulatory protein